MIQTNLLGREVRNYDGSVNEIVAVYRHDGETFLLLRNVDGRIWDSPAGALPVADEFGNFTGASGFKA